MSGDTQTKKRKDKKRKKDDEDTVKETTVHAPKQPSAGAAQAAKEPGDVQMHIHSDHGTGGHWCAKVVFFFLLGALGALIGLIIVENQGLSNDDTPLSESRYSEFFSGWVDETRQDDHHHEEILAAINSLDDHDDSVDDHDDSLDDHVEDHEAHEGEEEQDDDGAPYPEEEDNDDEEVAEDDGDEEEAAQAQKLDDDEVEEIYAQQEAAQQEANVNPEGDDGDDGDYDDGDDDDGDDDGVNDKTNVDDVKQNDKAGDDDKNDEDADEDNEPDYDKTKTVAETVDNEEENDDDEDDKDEQIAVKEDDDVKGKATNDKTGSNAELDDDDDDDGNTFKGIDDTPFEEIKLSNAMNDTAKQSLPIQDTEGTANAAPACLQEADSSKSEFCALPKQTEPNQATSPKSVSEHVTRDDLTDQMDELVRNYNKLAASLDVPQVEQTSSLPETVSRKDDDGDDFDGDEEETNKVGDGADENDDDEAAFDAFVDNDGGEEEYLARVRREQEQRLAAEEERKSAVEPEEETSQKSSGNVDDSKAKLENPTNIAQTAQTPSLQQPVQRTETAAKSVLDDFVYAGNPVQLSPDGTKETEGNVFILEDEVDARYSGDEYEYELEELDEMEEEIEEIPPADNEEEQNLIKQEQEIGAFVPITFEDFSSMYRPSPEVVGSVSVDTQEQQVLEQQQQQPQQRVKKSSKESLLARKKPPKGAFNKLIYGLHKDPIVIPAEEGDEEHTGGLAAVEARENVSAKGEARSVLTALLSEIPSPPPTELDHQFDKLVSPVLPRTTPQSDRSLFQRHSPVLGATGESTVALPSMAREKHVEFLLPDRVTEPEFELQSGAPMHPPADNGSKENLFVPDASEEELEPDEYGEEYDEYDDQEVEEEQVYDEDDIDSVLLNQYGSDEEEEPLTDDNIQPGGGEDDGSDVDDSDLMRRLEEKYGKLPAGAAPTPDASAKAVPSAAGREEPDDDEAVAAGWTKIPTRAEEAERSYQEELRRAQQQLDEGEAQEALSTFERVLSRKPHSIPALVGRGRALDALAEQRRSNAILNDAIVAYRKVIAQELAVDDATLASVAERCIDRLRFQGQHAKAIDVHQTLIRRFDDEPRYRNQLAVTYLYLNRLPEAKAVLHETLLRWIEDGFALVHYGFVLKTHDQNMELAAQYLREGIDTGHEGTQDGRFYFHLGDALQRLGRTGEAHDIYRRGVERKLFLSLYQRSLYNVDGLRSRPFWTEEQTTFAPELERIRSQWLLIRDEGMKLLTGAGVFVNETENLRDRGDWRQLELFARGARVERNCALAPLTCRLVEQHFPAARTCKRGQVKFSVMHPGTHVWPHCGPTNCRIRAHLGLNVPAGTYIRVAKQTRSWENGKWLIFDDSFEHEVWHNGTATRLVLIVDFWHPDLTESQRRSLSPI